MRRDLETRVARLEGLGPRMPIHAWDLTCLDREELRELLRLIDWLIGHDGDEDTLSPADRTSLRRLELRAGPAAGGLAP